MGAVDPEGGPQSRDPRGRRRSVRLVRISGAVGLAAIALGVGGWAGWTVTDHLEADNDFCNACHLSEGVPLHADIRRDFDARPPSSLAAAHAAARVEGRPEDPAFRCIDCHGGASFTGRVRVKALAARDAFWYVVGHFEEPDGMRFPLWDEDCRQCHASFSARGTAGSPAFHEVAEHNVNLGVTCVSCHLSHEPGAREDAWYLHPAHVRAECARCHPELGG